MQLADNMSHRCDSVIILFGDALLFVRALHAHTAELVDPEHFPIPSQAVLNEEHRATVVNLNGSGDHQHHRGCNNHSHRTYNDIENTLDTALSGRKALISEQQQRRIRNLNLLGTHDHNIRDLGNRIATDVIIEAVLQDLIADIRRDICH